MRVVVIGARKRLLERAGFDVVAVPRAVSHEFESQTGLWTVTTSDGRAITARIIVAGPGVPIAGPNTFSLPDNNFLTSRYIVRCLRMMGREDARRIELREGATISYWRKPNPHDYILRPYHDDVDDTHRGPAVLTANGAGIDVEVHLMGHIQPIDGSYRWYGRITAHPDVTALHQSGHKDVTVRLPGGVDAQAQLTELDPWGNARVTGTGRPPFPYP